MERFDGTWEYDPEFGAELDDAFGSDLAPGSDPEALYRSLVADEERCREWSDSVWELPGALVPGEVGLLFADPEAVVELGHEIRLTELWERCRGGSVSMSEFLELATLVTEVDGVAGDDCGDCAMLQRPRSPETWALGATGLCRAHLRFRLGHAEIDRSV